MSAADLPDELDKLLTFQTARLSSLRTAWTLVQGSPHREDSAVVSAFRNACINADSHQVIFNLADRLHESVPQAARALMQPYIEHPDELTDLNDISKCGQSMLKTQLYNGALTCFDTVLEKIKGQIDSHRGPALEGQAAAHIGLRQFGRARFSLTEALTEYNIHPYRPGFERVQRALDSLPQPIHSQAEAASTGAPAVMAEVAAAAPA